MKMQEKLEENHLMKIKVVFLKKQMHEDEETR